MAARRKGIAYIRQSVARGKHESPELQRAAIDRWAAEHNVEIVDEYRDLNRSGRNLTRPGMLTAREQIRNGDASGIVVAKSDRASRRTLDGLGLIDDLERDGHWIAAADGSIDTTTRAGRLATTMNFAIGQNEWEHHVEQSAEIHRRAVLEKGRHMGPAPFGYVRGPENRLVPDPPRADTVRQVFERRADGVGWLQISRELEHVRQANGRKVTPLLLMRMIPRRVYLGEAKHGDHVKAGAHEALIDEGLWSAANRVPKTVRSSNTGVTVEPLLRGLVRCAGCRYAMKRLPTRSGTTRWRCRTLVGEKTATHDCGHPAYLTGTQGAELDGLVVEEFFRLVAGVEVERVEQADDLGALQRRVAEAEALLDEVSSLEVRRDLGQERWAALREQARRESSDAQAALADAARRMRPGVSDVTTLRAWWEQAPLAKRQEALRSVIQAVFVVGGDGSVGGRVHVVPIWRAVDVPRQGSQGFVVRPFSG